MKRKIFAIIEVLLPIILFIVLLVSKLSDNLMYIIMMSAFIGWAIPYFVVLISGIIPPVTKEGLYPPFSKT